MADPVKPKHEIGDARRAADYRTTKGDHCQRCSRCHKELSLNAPIIYDVSGHGVQHPALALIPLLLGNELLGFICHDCRLSVCQHVASIFPDEHAFPFVNRDGLLVPNPRCETCSYVLVVAADGRTVVCPQCDDKDGAR